jgi:hypothetical protein
MSAPAAAPLDAGIRRFYVLIQGLKGQPVESPAWADMLFAIGEAWFHYQITDDDAAALETMLRTIRFTKR